MSIQGMAQLLQSTVGCCLKNQSPFTIYGDVPSAALVVTTIIKAGFSLECWRSSLLLCHLEGVLHTKCTPYC